MTLYKTARNPNSFNQRVWHHKPRHGQCNRDAG